jgi:hypothetical protein
VAVFCVLVVSAFILGQRFVGRALAKPFSFVALHEPGFDFCACRGSTVRAKCGAGTNQKETTDLY